jgi:hypothetical protein
MIRMPLLMLSTVPLFAACALAPVSLAPPPAVPPEAWATCEGHAKAKIAQSRHLSKVTGGVVTWLTVDNSEPGPGPLVPNSHDEAARYTWLWRDCAKQAGYPVDPGPEPGARPKSF